jgi:hypothetical protein
MLARADTAALISLFATLPDSGSIRLRIEHSSARPTCQLSQLALAADGITIDKLEEVLREESQMDLPYGE